MLIETALNQYARHQGFVYAKSSFSEDRSIIQVQVRPARRSRPVCSICGRPGACHDVLSERRYDFIPLWLMPVVLVYAPRRVRCRHCGVHVERIPWATLPKSPITRHLALWLSSWARELPWSTVARLCGVSWDTVAAAATWVVQWGMGRRNLDGVTSIGVDELYTGRRGKFITLVYELGRGCRRLLWMGRGKGSQTLERFFAIWGEERSHGLQHVCTDMSAAYITVVRRCCQKALLILDKFHIIKNLNEAITQTRRSEAARLTQNGKTVLKNARWILVKNRDNLKDDERERLTQILKSNLNTAKGYLLAEDFKRFWDYFSPFHARRFLESWITDVLRHRSLVYFKAFARTLRSHADLILNYFEARKEFTSAAVEMMNGQVRSTISSARGYRYDSTLEIALFLRLGGLPIPAVGYRFSG